MEGKVKKQAVVLVVVSTGPSFSGTIRRYCDKLNDPFHVAACTMSSTGKEATFTKDVSVMLPQMRVHTLP